MIVNMRIILPAMMAAITTPIEVLATISIFIFCFTSTLNTSQAKDPKSRLLA